MTIFSRDTTILESEGAKKIETLRKCPLKLSIYVRDCAAVTHKNKCFKYLQ